MLVSQSFSYWYDNRHITGWWKEDHTARTFSSIRSVVFLQATNFKSAFSRLGDAIDTRALQLAVQFYELPHEAAQSLSVDLANWLMEWVDDRFITRWDIDEKTVEKNVFSRGFRKLPPNLHSGTFSSKHMSKATLFTI